MPRVPIEPTPTPVAPSPRLTPPPSQCQCAPLISVGKSQKPPPIPPTSASKCNWRCPDNTDAPAPNPPGAWKEYLAPMNTTNYCKDHMTPVGFWSAPTLPTEGIPPAGELAPQPGETPAPQPIPPPLPTQPVPAPAVPPTVPGEPNP